MAVSSSPIAPRYPPLGCIDLRKRKDLLKKPGNLQVGAMKSPVFPTSQVVTRLPVNAVLKPVSTEKTVLPYIRVEFKWLRQNDGCHIIRDDKEQGYMELEELAKKDLMFTCSAAGGIYKSKYLGTSMAPHVNAKMYILENPANQPKGMYMMSVNPVIVPTQIEYLDFDFVKIHLIPNDDQELSIATLLAKLNTVRGNYGIVLIDMDENQLNGMMSDRVYNTSGGTIMWHAVREFESRILAHETMQQKDMLEFKLANLVHSGLMSDPLCKAIMDMITEKTIGSVQIKLYRGSVTVTQCTTP